MEPRLGVAEHYFIRPDYTSRETPEYFNDEDSGTIWQPDVYRDAAEIAARLGAAQIIDLGCGEARKLVALYPRFQVVGVDFGTNIDFCREHFPFGRWIQHDFDSEGPLPFGDEELSRSVLVCADVIEHLVRPERLLSQVRRALKFARAAVFSTPERELTRGPQDLGPPGNPCHVREWAIREFRALLSGSGFEHTHVGLTRAHDHDQLLRSILAICYPSNRLMRRAQQRPL